MRLTCLLLIGLIAFIITSCRSSRLHDPPKEPGIDSLMKYSYLLITLGPDDDDKSRLVPYRNGTGFFYRQGDKLYLVSAYHVFSGCPLYKPEEFRDELEAMDIWYRNSRGRYRHRRLSLARWKNDSCPAAAQRADLDTVDVTALFKGIDIHSIEGLVCNPCGLQDTVRPLDQLVCYGYPNVSTSLGKFYYRGNLPETSTKCMSRGVERVTHYEDSLGFPPLYYIIGPRFPVGASGAPVFRIGANGTSHKDLDMVGIQSGSDSVVDHSTVVKQKIMISWLTHLVK